MYQEDPLKNDDNTEPLLKKCSFLSIDVLTFYYYKLAFDKLEDLAHIKNALLDIESYIKNDKMPFFLQKEDDNKDNILALKAAVEIWKEGRRIVDNNDKLPTEHKLLSGAIFSDFPCDLKKIFGSILNNSCSTLVKHKICRFFIDRYISKQKGPIHLFSLLINLGETMGKSILDALLTFDILKYLQNSWTAKIEPESLGLVEAFLSCISKKYNVEEDINDSYSYYNKPQRIVDLYSYLLKKNNVELVKYFHKTLTFKDVGLSPEHLHHISSDSLRLSDDQIDQDLMVGTAMSQRSDMLKEFFRIINIYANRNQRDKSLNVVYECLKYDSQPRANILSLALIHNNLNRNQSNKGETINQILDKVLRNYRQSSLCLNSLLKYTIDYFPDPKDNTALPRLPPVELLSKEEGLYAI